MGWYCLAIQDSKPKGLELLLCIVDRRIIGSNNQHFTDLKYLCCVCSVAQHINEFILCPTLAPIQLPPSICHHHSLVSLSLTKSHAHNTIVIGNPSRMSP